METWRAFLALRGTFFILIRVHGAFLAAFVLVVSPVVELACLALFARLDVVALALVLDVHARLALNMPVVLGLLGVKALDGHAHDHCEAGGL